MDVPVPRIELGQLLRVGIDIGQRGFLAEGLAEDFEVARFTIRLGRTEGYCPAVGVAGLGTAGAFFWSCAASAASCSTAASNLSTACFRPATFSSRESSIAFAPDSDAMLPILPHGSSFKNKNEEMVPLYSFPALKDPLSKAVGAPAEEFHEAHVPEDLKLLPNLVADLAVARVKPSKVRLKAIDVVSQGEILFAQRVDGPQHVQGPAAGLDT